MRQAGIEITLVDTVLDVIEALADLVSHAVHDLRFLASIS